MQNKLIGLLVLLSLVIPKINAQEFNVDDINSITTAAPFLLITPDGRAGGMGDIGVATTSDFNSQHHNPSKVAFNDAEFSVGINFTPWMRELVNDVYLGGFSVASKIDERSAWATSFKYFTLGEIQLTDDIGTETTVEKPNELALDGTYALKLTENFSMGVTLRYIRSDFALKTVPDSNMETVNAFSVDLSGYYQGEEKNYGDFNGIIRGGFNIANIGPKVTYVHGGRENFIPTNMKLGGGFDFILDNYNTVSLNLETTKLLVPTPPYRERNDDGSYTIIEGKDNDVGFVNGMFQSFNDAPGGSKEELREYTWAIGSEYLYNDVFALRGGYFHEHETKGARQFFTLGAGFKFKATNIDISYLFNTSNIHNPLENTLRFSLGINLGESFFKPTE